MPFLVVIMNWLGGIALSFFKCLSKTTNQRNQRLLGKELFDGTFDSVDIDLVRTKILQ